MMVPGFLHYADLNDHVLSSEDGGSMLLQHIGMELLYYVV